MKMNVSYGSELERFLLGSVYLAAATASAIMLFLMSLLFFPYLLLPLYLALCSIPILLFPLSGLAKSRTWQGLYRCLPALFFMGAISIASSFTFGQGTSLSISDIIIHGAEFFVLGFMTCRLVDPTLDRRHWSLSLLLALVIVAGFGCLDEIHQASVPGRTPSVKDLLSDVSGGLLGILTYSLLTSRLRARGRR